MKVTLSEIKKNLQGTNSDEKEAGIQSNDLEHKEETKIQKNEHSIRRLLDTSKCANIRIIGLPERKEEEEESEILFEKIMKENFPNLAKEIDKQVQETQRVPKKLVPK